MAATLGESSGSTVKSLSAIVPLLLSSLAGKASSGGDLGGILSLVKSGLSGGNPLDNVPALLSGVGSTGGAEGLASQLLGANLGPATSTVANLFGMKNGSVSALLGLAGPLIIGGLGKIFNGVPTVDGLKRLLLNEKDSYAAALPTEIRRFASPTPVSTPPRRDPEPVREEKSSGWWKWLLLALGLLGLLWWLFGRNHREEPVAAPVEHTETVAPATPVVPAGAGVTTEERAGKPALVVFFDVGKSAVTNDLAAASARLKDYVDANPTARVSVSGFNDPTGDAAANAALSKNRAEQVKSALVAAGLPADRIDLDKPVAPTDTSETYAAARRVEVTIK